MVRATRIVLTCGVMSVAAVSSAAAQVSTVPAPAPPPAPAPVPALTTTPAPAPAAPAAPIPAVPPTPTATPADPAIVPATPRDNGFLWAARPQAALARDGAWDPADDVTRDATRRDLARALAVLMPSAGTGSLPTDVAAQDPAAGPIAAAVSQRWLGAPGGLFRPDAPVTARAATTAFLRALGMRPSMAGLARIHTSDGARLTVPAGFPSAVLGRELGFRYNYPAPNDVLERPDSAPLRVADLLAMTQRARSITLIDRSRAARYDGITLPPLTPAQKTVVEAALAEVGMPYIWGGDWPTSASPWGYQAQGGFDCSGLVWMAFKGATTSQSIGAGVTLRGRTADAMAFENPAERVALSDVAPGDLVFFGDAGLKTRRGAVSHVGIALGNAWMIHSSGSRAGVTISSLETYWTSGQARARRPAVFGAPPPMTQAELRGKER